MLTHPFWSTVNSPGVSDLFVVGGQQKRGPWQWRFTTQSFVVACEQSVFLKLALAICQAVIAGWDPSEMAKGLLPNFKR
jgi:hypothetical protein